MSFSHRLTQKLSRPSLIPLIRLNFEENDLSSSRMFQESSRRKIDKLLLQRYHDESYIVEQKQLSKLNKLANFMNIINLKLSSIKKYIQRSYQPQQQQENHTISPQSPYLCAWNIIIGLIILFHFFQIPISIFFTEDVYKSEFNSAFGLTVNIITLVFLFINIVYVVPNTQFYQNGCLVTNQEYLIKKYLGWRLILDCLAWLFQLIYTISNARDTIYCKILFYLMVYRLLKIDQNIERTIELTKFRLACYKLTRLIIFLMFIMTWLACIFFAIDYHYYVKQQKYYPDNLWLMNSYCSPNSGIIQQYSWYIWLNYAYYWCLQTITMVGFGDITPKNPPQVLFTSFVIMLVILIYVFFVSNVWQIVSEAQQFSEYKKKQWSSFKEYQMQKILPLQQTKQDVESIRKFRQLKNKVGSYLYQMWNQQKIYSDTNIVQILQKSLNNQLKNQVFINYRQNLFQNVLLFSQLAKYQTKNHQFVFRELIFKIKQNKYASQQVIINFNKVPDKLSYLINGKIQLFYPNSHYNMIISHKFNKKKLSEQFRNKQNNNYNYAVKQFLIQQPLPYIVKSSSFCKVSQLSHEDFIQCLKTNQQLYIRYCYLRDQIKIYNNNYLTGEVCFQCQSYEHVLEQCNQCDYMAKYKEQIFIQSLNKRLIKVFSSSQKSGRSPIKRRSLKSNKISLIKLDKKINENIDIIKNYKSFQVIYNV